MFSLTTSFRQSLAPISRRSFAQTPRFLSASGSNRHGNDPNVIGQELERNMKGEQGSSAPFDSHAPGWNEKLASDSEASVKADTAPDASIEQLQKDTVAKHSQDQAEPRSHATGPSIVPEIVQKYAPEAVEKVLPEAVHPTNPKQ